MVDVLSQLSALPAPYLSWIMCGTGARGGCLLAVVPILLDTTDGKPGSELEVLNWFIAEGEAGIPLTEKFNLSRSFIRKADERFPWLRPEMARQWPLQRDTDFPQIVAIRELASKVGAVRRVRRTLMTTKRGRRLLANRDSLWDAAVEVMIDGDDFHVEAGEILLAILLSHYPDGAAWRAVQQLVGEVLSEGWEMQFVETFGDGDYPAATWEVRDNVWLWEALRLVNITGGLGREALSLTEAGRAMAVQALKRQTELP